MILFLLFSQFSLADSLYANGYYDPAVIEYKREFFFITDLYKDPPRRLRYAISCLKTNRPKGLEEFEKIIKDFPDLAPASKILMAKYYLDIGNYSSAVNLLTQTPERRLLGFAHLLDGQFAEACTLFVINREYELAGEVAKYIHKPKKFLMTATLLSLICPGAGEIYAGNIKFGFIDFFLNLGTGFLFYDAIKDKRYVDATLISSFLFYRFYFGSLANAQRLAQQRNEKDQEQWLNYIKRTYFEDSR